MWSCTRTVVAIGAGILLAIGVSPARAEDLRQAWDISLRVNEGLQA